MRFAPGTLVNKLIVESQITLQIALAPKSTATTANNFSKLVVLKESDRFRMGTIHNILEVRGKAGALDAGLDRSLVETASLYMSDEDGAFNFAYSGWAQCALPHRRLAKERLHASSACSSFRAPRTCVRRILDLATMHPVHELFDFALGCRDSS